MTQQQLEPGQWLVPIDTGTSHRLSVQWVVLAFTRQDICKILEFAEWLEREALDKFPGIWSLICNADQMLTARTSMLMYREHEIFQQVYMRSVGDGVVGQAVEHTCIVQLPDSIDLQVPEIAARRVRMSEPSLYFTWALSRVADVRSYMGTINEHNPLFAKTELHFAACQSRTRTTCRSILIPVALLDTAIHGIVNE